MKRTNYKIFTVMLLAAVLFSGCGLNRMVRNYDEGIRYTPAVNPLENHGGQVAAEVQGTISEGYFLRKAMLELTPVLTWDGGEQELPAVILRGSSTTAEGQMITRDQSTNFDMNNIIEYQQEMEQSELVIRARLYREGRENRATTLPERKVADGVINTSQRVDKEGLVSYAPHQYELETIITQQADLFFDYMRHNVNMRNPLNRDTENQEALKDLEEFLTRGWEIRSIEINAWASPEGEIAFNEKLSENRATSGERFFNDMVRRLNRNQDEPIQHPDLNVRARGEDFDNFMSALNESDIPDKQAIANVVNSELSPAERERRIRDMTVIYNEIEEILQPLRRAEFVVQSFEPKKTQEEIAELSTSNPSELNEEELFYAATLTEELQTKLDIYNSAQELYPSDYRGFNNAGAIHLQMQNIDQAAKALERANQLEPNNGHVLNNLGVVAARNNDYENASSLFKAARDQGIDVSENEGALMIIAGDYQAASSSFAGVTCTYNVALAQFMAGNIQAATNTLNCAPESAQVYYLKAVIGARQDNNSVVFENLRQAIEMDPAYAEMASKDAEFIRLRSLDQFQDVIN